MTQVETNCLIEGRPPVVKDKLRYKSSFTSTDLFPMLPTQLVIEGQSLVQSDQPAGYIIYKHSSQS